VAITLAMTFLAVSPFIEGRWEKFYDGKDMALSISPSGDAFAVFQEDEKFILKKWNDQEKKFEALTDLEGLRRVPNRFAGKFVRYPRRIKKIGKKRVSTAPLKKLIAGKMKEIRNVSRISTDYLVAEGDKLWMLVHQPSTVHRSIDRYTGKKWEKAIKLPDEREERIGRNLAVDPKGGIYITTSAYKDNTIKIIDRISWKNRATWKTILKKPDSDRAISSFFAKNKNDIWFMLYGIKGSLIFHWDGKNINPIDMTELGSINPEDFEEYFVVWPELYGGGKKVWFKKYLMHTKSPEKNKVELYRLIK